MTATAIGTEVADLRTVFATGRTRSYAWRRAQLDGLERFLKEEEPRIAAALAADLGRSSFDTWFADIAATLVEVKDAQKRLRSWMRPRRTGMPLLQQPARGRIEYEPLGVVLVIGPWNYPFYLTIGPLVAALAAGNAVVLKPSELAPESSRVLAELLPRYLDAEAVRVVEGDGAVTQRLIAQGFDHILFTGGTEIGRRIAEAAAPLLTPVTLELGGKSPVIVARDADLEVAARRIAWIKVLNSGQTCIAPDYVLVERAVQARLVELIAASLTEFTSAQAERGLRIVNRRQFDRLAGALAESRGTIAFGGGIDAEAVRIEPTIVVDPSADEPLLRDEIFGPVLPVVTVDSIAEAIARVTAGPKPLAAYFFTRSSAVQRRLLDGISSGGAVINHIAMHCMIPDLPFGGVGSSGMGSYHGRFGFETFSHRKAVLVKPFRPDLRMLYPPHPPREEALLRKLF